MIKIIELIILGAIVVMFGFLVIGKYSSDQLDKRVDSLLSNMQSSHKTIRQQFVDKEIQNMEDWEYIKRVVLFRGGEDDE